MRDNHTKQAHQTSAQPTWRHKTEAALSSKLSSQTGNHFALWRISTLPALVLVGLAALIRRTEAAQHVAASVSCNLCKAGAMRPCSHVQLDIGPEPLSFMWHLIYPTAAGKPPRTQAHTHVHTHTQHGGPAHCVPTRKWWAAGWGLAPLALPCTAGGMAAGSCEAGTATRPCGQWAVGAGAPTVCANCSCQLSASLIRPASTFEHHFGNQHSSCAHSTCSTPPVRPLASRSEQSRLGPTRPCGGGQQQGAPHTIVHMPAPAASCAGVYPRRPTLPLTCHPRSSLQGGGAGRHARVHCERRAGGSWAALSQVHITTQVVTATRLSIRYAFNHSLMIQYGGFWAMLYPTTSTAWFNLASASVSLGLPGGTRQLAAPQRLSANTNGWARCVSKAAGYVAPRATHTRSRQGNTPCFVLAGAHQCKTQTCCRWAPTCPPSQGPPAPPASWGVCMHLALGSRAPPVRAVAFKVSSTVPLPLINVIKCTL